MHRRQNSRASRQSCSFSAALESSSGVAARATRADGGVPHRRQPAVLPRPFALSCACRRASRRALMPSRLSSALGADEDSEVRESACSAASSGRAASVPSGSGGQHARLERRKPEPPTGRPSDAHRYAATRYGRRRSLFAAHHDSASGRKRRAFRSVVETCLNLAMFTESYAEYLFHRKYVLKAGACMPPESVKG